MLRVNEYRFYELGMKVHPLTDLDDEAKYRDYFYTLFEARSDILQLLEGGIVLMRVCRPVANEVVNAIDAIVSRDFREAVKKASDEELGLPRFAAYHVREAVKKFETILAAELQALDTYFVSQKGSYSTPDLIERAEIMFPESIRAELPSSVVGDWREAGRCLVLDTPTAAGFHILRAVEGVMAEYYKAAVGTPIPSRMRNWGVYIRKLRKSAKSDSKVTDFLDHIREQYRNPVSHPEAVLTPDEAEVLLGVAASSIRQMILALQALRNPPPAAQELLPLQNAVNVAQGA